ncbi:MAG: acyl-CoA dehydrogenase family protein [Pseudomonadota bacterium]
MDFEDTQEEADFRAEARAFLDKHATALEPGEVVKDQFSRNDPSLVESAKTWQALKKDNGWACLTWPTAYGGRDASPIQQVIWTQEESRYRVPPNIFAIGIGMLGPTLMKHGTDEQKSKHLERLARGDDIWCQLFSEPAAGSDVAGLRTRAVRDGDDWIINGQKIWTTGAHFCDYGMVITRSDPDAPKHKGLTYFIVDMTAPGVEIRPIQQINGGAMFNEVFFTDVRIPDSNRVGEINEGWQGAITTLMNERATIQSRGIGPLGPMELIRMASETEGLRGKAIDDNAVRQKLADFYVKTAGLKYAGYRTLTALSKGAIPGPESSIGKMVGGPLRQSMAEFGMELQGIAGSLMDSEDGCQLAYMSAPSGRIAGGTDEIMRNILAERVLGLPAEPRVDKDVSFRDIPKGV